jgi:hypothetical protein
MARAVMMLALALALTAAADAGAQPKIDKQSKTDKAQKAPQAREKSLVIYLAKGEANACGEGCSEWIAAEGRFDKDAVVRMRAFLQRHGARKLPVYFHSPGGDGVAAMAVGRMLRERGLTAGVALTTPSTCASARDTSPACQAAKRSNQPVAAVWRPTGNCNSACVYAVLGGTVRDVPPSARLGVHAAKTTMYRRFSDGSVQQITAKQDPLLIKNKAAEFDASLRRFIREMGIDSKLFETAARVPHESIRYLSRDQIAAFGIDRRPFVETSWFIVPASNGSLHLSKWIVEARGPERRDYRLSLVFFSCSQARRSSLGYLRGLASDEVGRPLTATFSIGGQKTRVSLSGAATRQDALDGGGSFTSGAGFISLDVLEAAANQDAIGLVEADPRADGEETRTIALATHGLAEGIKSLREKCTVSAPPRRLPPTWTGDAPEVPFVPEGKGQQKQSLPGMPTEKFMLLERKKKTK